MTYFWMRTALFCREFGRWKVNNLAVERKNFLGSPLPLAPEFFRNIRLLGRRPTLQQITENLIKKYGTHFLLSATLGGKVNAQKYCAWIWCDWTGPVGHNWFLCRAAVLFLRRAAVPGLDFKPWQQVLFTSLMASDDGEFCFIHAVAAILGEKM